MNDFRPSVGLLGAIMLVSGSMIGSGIFIVTAGMGRELGSSGWILLAWIVAGILTVLAALSYGELAAMMPKAGGQYVYIRRAFGPMPAFLYGWTVFTVIQTGVIAAVAMAFAKFSSVFFSGLSHTYCLWGFEFLRLNGTTILAVISILFLTWFNSRGIENGRVLQAVFTTTKILALGLLIGLGLWIGQGSNVFASNFTDMWDAFRITTINGSQIKQPLYGVALLSALGVAMVGSLFSSDAWNNITFIAGEVRNPQRNIPLSLFLGTLLVTTFYVLANISYMALLPLSEISMAFEDRVGTAAAKVIFGDSGMFLMAGLIMISTFGCNNGIVIAGGRLFYAMAKDGLFFRGAASLNKYSVPAYALWAQGIWASVLCLSGKYGDLLEYTTFASLLFYILTILGLFILRIREPYAERPYRAFGYPVLPALYVIFALAFCINLLVSSPIYTLAGLGIVLLGFPVYYLASKFLAAPLMEEVANE